MSDISREAVEIAIEDQEFPQHEELLRALYAAYEEAVAVLRGIAEAGEGGYLGAMAANFLAKMEKPL